MSRVIFFGCIRSSISAKALVSCVLVLLNLHCLYYNMEFRFQQHYAPWATRDVMGFGKYLVISDKFDKEYATFLRLMKR